MESIDLRFEQIETWLIAIGVFSLFMLALTALELVWDLVTKRKTRLWETGANVAITIGNSLLETTIVGSIFIIGLLIVEPLAFLNIPINSVTWIAAILLADLSYYWMHRTEHRVRILWAYHSVHHSSHEFDLTTALRLSWVESLVEWLFFVTMILLGFDAVQTLVAVFVVVVYQNWIHTQKVGKLAWLDKVFNTPSVHRVHHAQNKKYIDKNYGGILILWDRLFGTYKPEQEPVVFGITKPPGSANPVKVNFYEFMRLLKDCHKAAGIHQIWRYLFKPPGWQPE